MLAEIQACLNKEIITNDSTLDANTDFIIDLEKQKHELMNELDDKNQAWVDSSATSSAAIKAEMDVCDQIQELLISLAPGEDSRGPGGSPVSNDQREKI